MSTHGLNRSSLQPADPPEHCHSVQGDVRGLRCVNCTLVIAKRVTGAVGTVERICRGGEQPVDGEARNTKRPRFNGSANGRSDQPSRRLSDGSLVRGLTGPVLCKHKGCHQDLRDSKEHETAHVDVMDGECRSYHPLRSPDRPTVRRAAPSFYSHLASGSVPSSLQKSGTGMTTDRILVSKSGGAIGFESGSGVPMSAHRVASVSVEFLWF